MRKAKLSSLSCNNTQDDLVYFTFFPLTIFSLFLASDKFMIDDDYNKNVQIAMSVCQVLTHEFCINVIFIGVYEVYWSNYDKTHKLCKRPRVLEINSFFAMVSVLFLSITCTFGSLVDASHETATNRDIAVVAIPFWIITKVILLLSLIHLLRVKQRFNT
jgi:hypothetical protein